MTKQEQKDVDLLTDFYKFLAYVAVAVGLAVYLQVLQNRKYWITMEVCLGITYVLMFPFASTLSAYSVAGSGDELATYLFRLMLLGLLAQTVAVYQSRTSADPTVPISVSISNMLARGTLILCGIHGVYYTKVFAKLGWKANVDIVFFCLLLIGDCLHITKLTTRAASRTVGDPISFHLSLDAVITFILGAFLLGFSDMFIGAVFPNFGIKKEYMILTKIFGCTVLGGSILSFASLCYKYTNNATDSLKCRLAVYLPALLLAFVNALVEKTFLSYGHTVMIGVLGCLSLNAGFAVWQYEKAFSY